MKGASAHHTRVSILCLLYVRWVICHSGVGVVVVELAAVPPPQFIHKNGGERLKLSRATGDIRGGDFLCAGLMVRGGEERDCESLILLYYTNLLIYMIIKINKKYRRATAAAPTRPETRKRWRRRRCRCTFDTICVLFLLYYYYYYYRLIVYQR